VGWGGGDIQGKRVVEGLDEGCDLILLDQAQLPRLLEELAAVVYADKVLPGADREGIRPTGGNDLTETMARNVHVERTACWPGSRRDKQ
jgi:hypothetical protein